MAAPTEPAPMGGPGAEPRHDGVLHVAPAELHPPSPLIRIRGLHKRFGAQVVLDGVSFDIPEGRTTAIIGPSGTGKSVMLKHIVGLIRPDEGEVLCFGTDMARAPEAALYAARRRIGMLFQDGALFDSYSVGDNVAFPLLHHAPRMTEAERRAKVEEKLALVGSRAPTTGPPPASAAVSASAWASPARSSWSPRSCSSTSPTRASTPSPATPSTSSSAT